MRILSNARIVVVDGDPDHRAFLCSSLAALDMTQVMPAASVHEARDLIDPDLCILDARRLPAFTTNARIPSNPFDPSRTPAILIVADVSTENVKSALACGYAAVVGAPVVPRLLYRRIGSTLQKTRRAARRSAAALVAERAVSTAELLEG
jgi:DNA-binding response OmpR family regulator